MQDQHHSVDTNHGQTQPAMGEDYAHRPCDIRTSVLEHKRTVSTAQLRRDLFGMRDGWRNHSASQPIRLSARVSNGMTRARLTSVILYKDHMKRHDKSASSKRERAHSAAAGKKGKSRSAPLRGNHIQSST